jgi:hypothetical protein
MSITGAYGSGKSAFALFAAKALAFSTRGPNTAIERVTHIAPLLAGRLTDGEAGFWPILVTGVRAPIARALTDAIFAALERQADPAACTVAERLRDCFGSLLADRALNAREVASLVEMASKFACNESASCRGLLIVIDEAGKFLEYAAIHPARGDMQVLQEIAELAARSEDAPVILMTILHQAFDDYAHRLSPLQRTEWQKIHGRFVDVPFGDSPEETMRLISEAMVQHDADGIQQSLGRHLESDIEACEALHIFPPFLSAGEFREVLRRTYPFHALTLRVTPYVFRRFGQSERSLFSFLSSEEPFGFQQFLRDHWIDARSTPTLRIHHLYDYIVATLGSTLYTHTTAELWSEAEETLFRIRGRNPLYAQLIKTIAVLHILSEQTHIVPSKEMLVFALEDEGVSRSKVESAIDELEGETLIAYRQFKKAYRLYEGSDIDIDARLREAHVHFAHGTNVLAVADKLESNKPLVARRHSYETGTLRSFEVRYCRPGGLDVELERQAMEHAGLLIICIAADSDELERTKERLKSLLAARLDVIVEATVESEPLHEAAVAIESLLWVRENTPELRNDKVAMREVDERLADARQTFSSEWERLLRPQKNNEARSTWCYEGQFVPLKSYRELQELISTACDRTYAQTPHIRNELVNRRQLSSVAAAARRNLIEAMLQHHDKPLLEIEGFPPERSMYVSLLQSTGIHRRVSGEWRICPPTDNADEGLKSVWRAMEAWLFDGALHAQPITDLHTLIKSRPYGVTDGVVPVLLCAALLYWENEVTLYEEGRFVTDLDTATFERLIKRPEDFSVQGCRITGERASVVARFARGLLRDHEAATIVAVVRAIYRAFRALPDYTVRTKKLGPHARALRDLLRSSTEPVQLLFVDLPQCLGVEPFHADESDGENVDLFFSRWNATYSELIGAYSVLLRRIDTTLCTTFDVENWETLRHRAAVILPYVREPRLSSFARRAADEALLWEAWVTSVATVVVGRPPANWSDMDEQAFEHGVNSLASPFSAALSLAFTKKQQVAQPDQFAMRIAIANDAGAEDARVVVAPKAQRDQVNRLAQIIVDAVKDKINSAPAEIRMAAIAKAMQELLHRNGEMETTDE